MAYDINTIVSPEAIKGLTTLEQQTAKVVQNIIKIHEETSKLDSTLAKMDSSKVTKLETATKQATVNNEKLSKSTINLKKLQTDYMRTLSSLAKQKERNTKLTRAEIAANESGEGSYKRMSLELSKNIQKYQMLSKAERENKAIGGQLLSEINRQDAALKKLDSTMGRSQRSVGNYSGALKGFGRQLMGAMGLTAGVYLFIGAIKNAFNRIREFDKAMQNMAGIAGTSRAALAGVAVQIIKVARTSLSTSNQVAHLATVLFTLGKTKKEVIQMLKPVNDLSIALGSASDETADFLGQTLNAFGKGADSAQHFADVIANIRGKTALDFERIKESFGFIAPTAKALNMSLGETGAVIGILQNNGIKAARAGRLLNTSFARLVGEGLTLDEALKKINTSTDKVSTASKLFGKRSFTLGLILADNTDKTKKLAAEFDNMSDGALKKLTDEQLKSLDAKIKIANSAWEAFVLQIDSGSGTISKSFKKITIGFTDFINALSFSEKVNMKSGVGFAILRMLGIGDDQVKESEKKIDTFYSRLNKMNTEQLKKVIDEQKKLVKSWEKDGNVYQAHMATIQLHGMEKIIKSRAESEAEAIKIAKKKEKEAAIQKVRVEKEVAEKTRKLFMSEREKEIEAIDKKAKAYLKEGLKEVDVAKWVAIEKAKINADYYSKIAAQRAKADAERQKAEDKKFSTIKQPEEQNVNDSTTGLVTSDSFESYVKRVKAIKAIAKAASQQTVSITTISMQEITKLYNDDAINYKEYQVLKTKIEKEEAKKRADNVVAALQFSQDMGNMLMDGLMNSLQDQENALQAENDRLMSQYDAQRKKIEDDKKRDLAQAKGNVYEIARINKAAAEEEKRLDERKAKDKEKYNKKIAAIKTKEAKADKAQALFNIAINTAVAVSKVWGQTGIFGIAAQIPVLIMGALQAALVAARPIPKFAKGTENAPEGFAITGEAGREIIEQDGSVSVVEKPTLTYLKKGAKVFNNRETERIFATAGKDDTFIRDAIDNQTKSIVKAIKDKKEIYFDKTTGTITERDGNYFKQYINNKITW